MAAVYTGHHVEEAKSKLEQADNLNLASTVCSRWERTHNFDVFVSYLSTGESQIRIKRQSRFGSTDVKKGTKQLLVMTMTALMF